MNKAELIQFKLNLANEIVAKMKFTPDHNLFNFELPDGFVEWLLDNGELFEVAVLEIPKDLKITNSTAGNCFHNSQLIALENKNTLYYEGLWCTNKINNLTHHGFNAIKNEAFDVSYLANKFDYDQELKEKELYYFGIKINDSFFKDDLRIFEQKWYNNPLLLSYYYNSCLE